MVVDLQETDFHFLVLWSLYQGQILRSGGVDICKYLSVDVSAIEEQTPAFASHFHNSQEVYIQGNRITNGIHKSILIASRVFVWENNIQVQSSAFIVDIDHIPLLLLSLFTVVIEFR